MIRDVSGNGAADSNVLIVINDTDVVVDANIYPESAREAVAEIRKLTSRPVRYLINTHWHSDHHYGNQVYQQAYPGVEIVAHPATRDAVISRDIPSFEKNLTTEYPATVARIRRALETGKRSNGEALTPEGRTELTQALGVRVLSARHEIGSARTGDAHDRGQPRPSPRRAHDHREVPRPR